MRKSAAFISDFLTSFEGTRIHYEISGSTNFEKTVILLHGLGGNLTAWDPQVKELSKLGFTTISIDLRGYGLSDRPKKLSSYKINSFADDVFLLIKKYQLKNITIIGQCLGGLVALELIENLHVEPQSLVLIGSASKIPWYFSIIGSSRILSLLSSLTPTLHRRGHMAFDTFHNTADISLRRFWADITFSSPKSYLATCQSLFSFQGKEPIRNITCPTLIIHGGRDIIFPKRLAVKLHQDIEGSKLVTLPSGNHILLLNNPEDINQAIHQFIKTY